MKQRAKTENQKITVKAEISQDLSSNNTFIK